ncbi:MAG: MFS transporter [Propionibacteriaceae bacterium]|jgi:MFS family permease|nr:MFS transporter [Propionibacteriaceae bacterium]
MSTSKPPGFFTPRLIVSAYGPTFFSTIGYGALIPLIPLTALQLGASVPLSALVTGLMGVGTVVSDLPASWVTTKLGEKRSIILACLWDVVWMVVAFLATTLAVFALAVFAVGLSAAVFGLARQTYLTEAVPIRLRARAMSSLGGTFRMGGFFGPLAGAAIVASWHLQAAYVFAATMCLFAAAVTSLLPDLPDSGNPSDPSEAQPRLFTVLRAHRAVFVTLGLGSLMINLARIARQVVLPLWCEAIGLDPTQTSLIYAVSMGIDMTLFFLGGWIMDRFGRIWVALPSLIILGVGLISLGFTTTATAVIVVAVILGLGNGIGAGIILTLGSDASPTQGRAQFLAGWRLLADAGVMASPLAVAALTTLVSLGFATTTLGGLAFVGAAWLGYWLRHPRATQ